MRFVVHVGQTKAGSSTIQSFLGANHARLLDAGICYPGGGRYPKPAQHSWIATALAVDAGRVERLIDACRAYPVAILSGEVLNGMPADRLDLLHRILADAAGMQVRIVLYVRNIADRMLSRLAQKAKHGFGYYPEYANSFAAHAARTPDSLGRRIAQFESLFGAENVDVRLLEAAPELERDFMAAAGLPWLDGLAIPPPSNVSPDPITAQVLTLLFDEFGLWTNAARCAGKGQRLPRIENRYLRAFEPLVAGTDLSHPKLARFGDRLTEIRWRDEAAEPALEDQLQVMIDSLSALRETAARHKRRAAIAAAKPPRDELRRLIAARHSEVKKQRSGDFLLPYSGDDVA